MFHGSMVALVTPMIEGSHEVDYHAFDRLIEFHIENGTDAIVVMGTTGESATLAASEHCGVIKHAVKQVNHRLPVIAGTGANCTREAIALTRFAKEAGAEACLLVTPYYNKPTQEGLFQHYSAVAKAVAIPQILYNVPGRTACDLLPETVARLADTRNIVGIKEATGDIERTRQILALCNDSIEVYSGDDALAMALILEGAKGVISVTANVAPALMHAMCEAALQGDRAASEVFNHQLLGIHEAMFVESNPIPVKWALQRMGLMEGAIRLPLTPLSAEQRPVVEQALQSAGMINP